MLCFLSVDLQSKEKRKIQAFYHGKDWSDDGGKGMRVRTGGGGGGGAKGGMGGGEGSREKMDKVGKEKGREGEKGVGI